MKGKSDGLRQKESLGWGTDRETDGEGMGDREARGGHKFPGKWIDLDPVSKQPQRP